MKKNFIRNKNSGIMKFSIEMEIDGQEKDYGFDKIISETEPQYIHSMLVTSTVKLDKIYSIGLRWRKFEIEPNPKKNTVQRVNKGSEMKITIIEIFYMSHLEEK